MLCRNFTQKYKHLQIDDMMSDFKNEFNIDSVELKHFIVQSVHCTKIFAFLNELSIHYGRCHLTLVCYQDRCSFQHKC